MSTATVDDLFGIISRLHVARFSGTRETALQDGIEQLLTNLNVDYQREARLDDRSRIDFLVGRLGIEVKTAGSPTSVARQLKRYAETGHVDHLLLVTTRHTHYQIPSPVAGVAVSITRVGAI